MSKKKPRYVAHSQTYMAVEALTRHEKKSKPFIPIERGTHATLTKGTEVAEPTKPVEKTDTKTTDSVEDEPKKKTSKKK